MKVQPNHIDNPEQFRACKCAVCLKCWHHFTLAMCIYGGPFQGYMTNETLTQGARP